MTGEWVTPWDDLRFDGATKGIPLGTTTSLQEIPHHGWNLLAGDMALPVMVIKEPELNNNLEVMARYCAERNAQLAPHGKTTMSPQLFKRQLDAGAWGISAATMTQVFAMRSFGISRILLANQLVEPHQIAWLATELNRDQTFSFHCLVDSVEGVALLEQHLRAVGLEKPLNVILELGIPNGRAGVRDPHVMQEVLGAVRQSAELALAGVGTYEGLAARTADPEGMRKVAELLELVDEVARSCVAERNGETGNDPFLITAGGSVFFDEVVRVLGHWGKEPGVELVLRSGCYISHDHGRYHRLSPLDGRADEPVETLKPALEVWAAVLSRPEPDLVIVGAGKRDAPYDEDMPLPLFAVDGDGERITLEGAEVVRIMDQHVFMKLPATVPLSVGDRVVFGVSHPCLAFDKWRLIPVVDARYNVVDALVTYF